MTSYFPDQKSAVTVLRYRVVIEEIVVTAEKFAKFNSQDFDGDDVLPADNILEDETNKFEDWGWGSPSLMSNCSFVGEWGEGYVAFAGDVTSGSDDIFPGHHDSWAHSPFEPIPFACNDYCELLGLPDGHVPNPQVLKAFGHDFDLEQSAPQGSQE